MRRARKENQVVAAGPKTTKELRLNQMGFEQRDKEWGGGSGGCSTAAIQGHSSSSIKVVFRGADFLNGLLGHDIARCE